MDIYTVVLISCFIVVSNLDKTGNTYIVKHTSKNVIPINTPINNEPLLLSGAVNPYAYIKSRLK